MIWTRRKLEWHGRERRAQSVDSWCSLFFTHCFCLTDLIDIFSIDCGNRRRSQAEIHIVLHYKALSEEHMLNVIDDSREEVKWKQKRLMLARLQIDVCASRKCWDTRSVAGRLQIVINRLYYRARWLPRISGNLGVDWWTYGVGCLRGKFDRVEELLFLSQPWIGMLQPHYEPWSSSGLFDKRMTMLSISTQRAKICLPELPVRFSSTHFDQATKWTSAWWTNLSLFEFYLSGSWRSRSRMIRILEPISPPLSIQE